METRNENDTWAETDVLEDAAGTTSAAGWLHEHRTFRRTLLLGLDGAILALALWTAYAILLGQLRLAFELTDAERLATALEAYHRQFLVLLAPVIVVRVALFAWMGLYRGLSRYVGLFEMTLVAVACGIGTLLITIFNLATPIIEQLGPFPQHASGEYLLRVPWGVVLLDAVFSVTGVMSLRLGRRLAVENLARLRARHRRRVLILGAGDAGEQVVRDMLRTHFDAYLPVAFLDPDPNLMGRRIHGIPVLGGLESLEVVAERERIGLVVIALPRPSTRQLNELVDACQRSRMEFQIVPELDSMLKGDVQISALRPVEIEDLLGRPPIVLPKASEQTYLTGKRVLVTGAGGSIGSELCRQILEHRPASLTLIGRGENSIYEIQHELNARSRELNIQIELYIGDVRDGALMEQMFARLQPQIVMHAAAHKHVHFMEAQPCEAIKNNVLGTRNVAEAALACEAERFVLISTDKAVNPGGAMGASKRLCEMLLTALHARGTKTRLIAVRFGNVLGSRGSVIPLFRRQIQAGGPITITHPEVTRYFMTIPEAVSLVIAAGNQGHGGEVYLLDMGSPVKIVDLARNLITLSGQVPGRDIAIEFTGLRPGEKLHEDLHHASIEREETEHEKIFRCIQHPLTWETYEPQLDALIEAAHHGQEDDVMHMMKNLMDDFTPGGDAS